MRRWLYQPDAGGARTVKRRNLFLGAGLAVLRADSLESIQAATKSVNGKSIAEVAADEDFWFQVRHAFSIERNNIHLNNDSVCPTPKSL